MKINYTYPLILLTAILMMLPGCANRSTNNPDRPGPKMVKVVQQGDQFTLMVDGQPFFVKGAGCEFGDIPALAQHGANSFRTWRTDNGQQTGEEVLNAAYEHGLMVCMGIEIGRERHGFDYNDPAAVREQYEFVKQEVLKYKDHPALLAWGIGNELNLHSTNPAVWDAVEDIALMIKEIDPRHPVTTMLAGFGKGLWEIIKPRCQSLDFLSFQFYADIVNLPKYIEEAGYEGPYLVTEWGATGHWESPLTDWGRPIEQNSREKAESYLLRYQTVIEADPKRCLGSYVFLWGQKQERTPTWYGMFLENGDKTASIDVMHYVWNGHWPENQTPRLDSLRMNGQSAYESVTTTPGQQCLAAVYAVDPDGDDLTISWEIIPEVAEGEQSEGGDFERRPGTIQTDYRNLNGTTVEFIAPAARGEYRLFVYVSDGNGSSGTANIPFLVK
ncbi:MAG: glycoside hydrolase family 2 TIM barrel-domain containing protein [Bacteroidales bacterium]